jgi:hypothetical protein
MDDTKPNEPAYSNERTEAMSLQIAAEATNTAESQEKVTSAESPMQTQDTQGASLQETPRTGAYSSLAELVGFVKRTRQIWLTVAGAVIGLMVMVTLVKDMTEWVRNARERRQEQAVASVTPERLIARCGQPAADTTNEIYPILLRTLSYQHQGDRKLMIEFSRTAEAKSDWVFLSMEDESNAGRYDTPDAEIAALPCLDSKK